MILKKRNIIIGLMLCMLIMLTSVSTAFAASQYPSVNSKYIYVKKGPIYQVKTPFSFKSSKFIFNPWLWGYNAANAVIGHNTCE